MKRKAAIFMTVIMLAALLLPLQGFAQKDTGMENALKTVKSVFKIPQTLKDFDYSINSENNLKSWSFTWSNRKNENDGNLSVTVNEKGTIINYYFYKPTIGGQNKLPKISKQQAVKKAEEFIKKINPNAATKIRLQEVPSSLYAGSGSYYFTFVRIANGLPFYDNNIGVEVNRETGEINSYTLNWSDDVTFPDPKKALSLEDAQKIYKAKLGYHLIYNSTYVDEKVKIYAVYTSVYNSVYSIDALSGDVVRIQPIFYNGFSEQHLSATAKYTMADRSVPEVQLSPDELEAIEKVSKLVSQEDAEKICRNLKVLNITADYKLMSGRLQRDWQEKSKYLWYMDFVKEVKGSKESYDAVNITIDAVSGELLSFYQTAPIEGDAKFDKAAAQKEVEKFLKEVQQAKYNETVYDANVNMDVRPLDSAEMPKQYSFTYVRKVNGILFPANYLSVSYDAVTGRISSFGTQWLNTEFPSIDKVQSLDSIYNKLFKNIGLELQYKAINQPAYYEKILPPAKVEKPDVKLVYDLKNNKPSQLDANTGEILDYDGKPYKENIVPQYKDIKGHYAESKILTLAENGVSLDGTEFKPDTAIKQKDFLKLLSKSFNYYWAYYAKELTDKETEQMYNNLVREGVIKEAEKAPEAKVTRQDAVKFMIRAMKYDKVADLKGIYKYPFKDIKKVKPELIGYVTIAHGLKLINGYSDGNFNPNVELTRAQTIVLIYNYMQN